MANSAHLGGHIEIGTRAILGGIVAVHQFVRVGEYALVGGVSRSGQRCASIYTGVGLTNLCVWP